jgi:hypothetical protein
MMSLTLKIFKTLKMITKGTKFYGSHQLLHFALLWCALVITIYWTDIYIFRCICSSTQHAVKILKPLFIWLYVMKIWESLNKFLWKFSSILLDIGEFTETYWHMPFLVKIRWNLQTLYVKIYMYLCVYFVDNLLHLLEWKVFQML